MQNQICQSQTSRFIGFPEVTHITSLKKTTLYSLIKLGELKPIKLGRKTVFLESEVLSWVNNKRAMHTPSHSKEGV
jgi:predicted DNA-binding transcriptional regulator AlpA